MKNLLIIGGTSGIIVPCLENFIKKYNVYATYSKKRKFKKYFIKSKKIKKFNLIKLDFNSKNSEIIKIQRIKELKQI